MQGSHTMRQEYRPEIDGLRAIAVVAVLLFHFSIPGFGGGFVGVDIFFVISGYLITGIIYREKTAGKFSFTHFYIRRIRRIFPALFAVVVATFVIGAIVMSPWAFRYLSLTSIAALLSFSNITFWLQSDYFDPSKWTKPLLHTWSLGVEEQFYLLWPAVIVLFAAAAKRTALLAILLIGVASLIAAEIAVRTQPSASFYLLPFRVCEFMAGAILVWLPSCDRTKTLRNEIGFYLGLVAIFASIALIDTQTPFPGLTALAPCIGTALCIYFGGTKSAAIILGNAPAAAVGRISYSLYLTHWPIVVFAKYMLLRELTPLETLAGIALSILTALLLYRYVELRFRYAATQDTIETKRVGLWVAACIALVALPAASAQIDGWRWRSGGNPDFSGRFQYHRAYYGGVDCKDTPCETNPNTDLPKVYVIGDSHARGLYEGLKRAIPGINFVIYGPNACAVYSPSFLTPEPRFVERCRHARSRAFAQIKESNAPVILFQFWSYYAELSHASEGPQLASFRATSAEEYAAFVRREIAGLQKLLGPRDFIVIGGVPTFASLSSPLDCISRPLQGHACVRSARDTQTNRVHDRFNAAFAAPADKSFVFLNPFELFCDKTSCANVTPAGRIIYSDADHLSVWGSEYVAGRISETLRALKPAR